MRALIVPIALGALAACGSDGNKPDAGATFAPNLAAIRSEIFSGTCALSTCHAPPTVAAKLDLRNDGLCSLMVGHSSCLFGERLIIVPGKPDLSFLVDKLRGRNLATGQDPTCGTTNMQMPSGGPPLAEDKIVQIETWIRNGASCGDDPASDAGVDGPVDGGDTALADVATLTALATTIKVGERTQATVTLTHGAPPQGQTIIIDSDDTAFIGVPASFQVAPGDSTYTFDVLGKQPAAMATFTASSGTNSRSLTMTVVSAVRAIRSEGPPAR